MRHFTRIQQISVLSNRIQSLNYFINPQCHKISLGSAAIAFKCIPIKTAGSLKNRLTLWFMVNSGQMGHISCVLVLWWPKFNIIIIIQNDKWTHVMYCVYTNKIHEVINIEHFLMYRNILDWMPTNEAPNTYK